MLSILITLPLVMMEVGTVTVMAWRDGKGGEGGEVDRVRRVLAIVGQC